MLHLFAGEKEGFPLEAAFKEVGLQASILEVDIKRGQNHDVLDDRLCAALVTSILQGQVKAVVGGPNCRTRSVLRHYEKEGAPRPVRELGEGPGVRSS